MPSVAELKVLNADRWGRAKLADNRKAEATLVAKRLLANKVRYLAVQARTGVPWFIVACIHEREASGNFKTQLGQGDPLASVSRHVPKGRGPFKTWEDGAYDALVLCPPFATRNKDWTKGGALTLCEQYNGLGPENAHRIPSGYIWAATNIQERGKYVRDGVWDANVWDDQLGVAAILLAMRAYDPAVRFTDEVAPVAPPAPIPVPAPVAVAVSVPTVAPETLPTPTYPAPPENAPAASPEAPKVASAPLWQTIVTALFKALFSNRK